MGYSMSKKVENPTIEKTFAKGGDTFNPNLEHRKFFNMPTSPATEIILKVIGIILKVIGSSKKSVAALNERTKRVNHNQQIKILKNGEKRSITVNNSNSKVSLELELEDIKKLTGSNKTTKKFFIFNLIKINEQAYSAGELRRNYIQFPIQELLDIGFYNTYQSARKGFENGMDVLTDFKLKGSMRKGKKEIATGLEVLFTGANVKNGVCTVFINERVNWAFIAAFYTILPDYSFKLSSKAFDLIIYIFYLARQNLKLIETYGSFNISLRAIQNRLHLPSETENKDPQRTIKEPIERAIKDIMYHNKSTEFTIKLIANNDVPTAAYLNNGYIIVALKGKCAKDFIDISKNKTKQIETSIKRQRTIMDNAIAINMAKKLDKEKK